MYLPPCATFYLFYRTGPLSPVCQSWRALQSQTTPCCTICYNVLQNCDSSATTTQDPPGGLIGSQRDVGDCLLLLLCCLLLRFTFDDKLLPYLTVVANKCYGSVETAWSSITTASSKKQTNIALHSFREGIRLITRSSFYKYFSFFCFSSQSTAPYSSSVGGDNVYGS